MAYNFIIEPKDYNAFNSEAEQIDQCKEWGLLSEKASKIKSFYYKRSNMSLPCSIIGYVDRMTAVIELDNGQKHCIHPSYLKEMQAANFNQKLSALTDETAESEEMPIEKSEPAEVAEVAESSIEVEPEEPKTEQRPKEKAKKGKSAKLELPEEKVRMTATVKEFTTVPNNFSDNDDEVIIYEAVSIADPPIEVGDAWSSHSATLKKLELEIGDTLSFEAKIVAKKLTRHPVPYKINNPSKIQKA